MKSLSFSLCLLVMVGASVVADDAKPNILWLTCEDIGPELGCYGDEYATTPHLDAFAKRSLTYLNAWSTAPVCAPARTTLITGMYPPSTGSEHMRSMTRLPSGFLTYPQYLRQAGYYCINPGKEDYNIEKPGQVWDKPGKGNVWETLADHQPFMAVFNNTQTHESKIRKRPHEAVHDPAKAPLPAYHPDTPEVRQDWAQYYDNITTMDRWFGDHLIKLEEAGLADNTIVFFYGDHGSGMPRSKRWPYNSGLRVPLLVYIPPKFRDLAPEEYVAGSKTDRLVGFVDFASTVISLAGVKPPKHLQGHAFLGKYATEPQPYLYGFRGRMDERYDMVRVVRNQRYIYIRNYMPHKIYGQFIDYMFVTPTTRVWHDLYHAGELEPPKTHFWERKPAEELYDLAADPDETVNLAGDPEHHQELLKLRKAQRALALSIRDVGFLPEDELHHRAPDLTPYELGHNKELYPFGEIFETAEIAASDGEHGSNYLIERLGHGDSAVRYWAALGLLMRETAGVEAGREALHKAMSEDPSPSVRAVAAEALGRYGSDEEAAQAAKTLVELGNGETYGIYVAMLALNGLDAMDARAASVRDEIDALPRQGDWTFSRGKAYVANLIKKTLRDLDETQE